MLIKSLAFITASLVLFIEANALDCSIDQKTRFTVEGWVWGANSGLPDKFPIYYGLINKFKKNRPTVFIIPGGPGGTTGDVQKFIGPTPFTKIANIVTFDHRGVGCTKKLNPNMPEWLKGLYSLERASEDIENIRQDLITRGYLKETGKQSKWFIFGASYGGMLGYQYATDFPGSIQGLMLGSTFHAKKFLSVTRSRWFEQFVTNNPGVEPVYQYLLQKYPSLQFSSLWAAFPIAYSYQGRTVGIKKLFERIVAAPDLFEAEKIINESKPWWDDTAARSGYIPCASFWDFPPQGAENNYFSKDIYDKCLGLEQESSEFDLTEQLKKLKVRTLLFHGKYDPITAVEATREAHELIPNSLYWENQHIGHGMYTEKSTCTFLLTYALTRGFPDAVIKGIIKTPICQGAPK